MQNIKTYLNTKKYTNYSIILFFCPFFIFSQLSITNNNSATALAQTILGNGIVVSNATLNCGNSAAATFTYSGANLGITDGILLTTGYAINAANPGAYFCNVTNGNNFQDPDLISVSTMSYFDVCILNFDFIPICDTLRVSYVFGSEEYPKYLHAQYCDVFGMFLTGPNPAGGNYTSKNIATLPNGTTPVSVDSVNGGWPTSSNASHSQYYHDNYTAPNNDIAYDGYTIPINSKAALVPCSSYHMKIAIADGANGHNDSGVFIKGNSLTCNNVPVITSNTVFACAGGGTANVNIANYSGTPSFTWYPGGQTTDSIKNVPAGTYTCIIKLPGICSNFTVSATLPTFSTVNISSENTNICKGHSIQLSATGATTYTWSPSTGLSNNHISNPIASPAITTVYTVTGTSASDCVSSQSIAINVSTVNLSANFIASLYETDIDNPVIHFYDNSVGATSWIWDFQEPGGSSIQNPTHSFSNPGTYIVHLVISDSYNCIDSISKKIVIDDIIKDLFTFYAPDSFTPNADLLNDLFLPIGVGWNESDYKLEIYDRWGALIFKTNDSKKGWNGMSNKGNLNLPADVYIWTVSVKDIYGKTYFYKGHVILLE